MPTIGAIQHKFSQCSKLLDLRPEIYLPAQKYLYILQKDTEDHLLSFGKLLHYGYIRPMLLVKVSNPRYRKKVHIY